MGSISREEEWEKKDRTIRTGQRAALGPRVPPSPVPSSPSTRKPIPPNSVLTLNASSITHSSAMHAPP